jgi:uncharacterized protein (TIGR02246 family)
MKKNLALAIAALTLLGVSPAAATPLRKVHSDKRHQSRTQQEGAGIEKLLKSYERSLDAGDVGGVVRLYTDDGVLMAPEAPSAVGIRAVRNAYTQTFRAIDLDITFEIAELKVLSQDWAFLRTNSTGTITIRANGAQVPEGNQELFLLQKRRGHWRIARYSFSSFLQPAG